MAHDNIAKRFLDAGEEPTKPLPPLEGYEKKDLVSLEEAVKSIDVSIHNLDAMVWTAKRSSRNPSDGLTSDESASIYLYTLEWPEGYENLYNLLNKRLRSEQRKGLTSWFSYLKLFLTALYKLPSTKKTVWRGIRGDVSHLYNDDFIWWGFSSCTTTIEVTNQFLGPSGVRTIFMIECSNGKVITSHSFYQNENEILLMPGTFLRVKGKSNLAKDLYMIHLQEENPPHQLLKSPFNLPSPSVDVPSLNKLEISKSTLPKSEAASVLSYVKSWFDLQYHHTNGKLKKPNEIENDMCAPDAQIDRNILNHIQGSIIGLALGDAVGAHVEYRPHQYLIKNPVTRLQGGGTWGLKKGQFTDDTSMALCLANSLVACRDFVPYDQLVRYKWWYKYGYMSSTGQCFDIEAATRQSILEFERRQQEFAKKYNIKLEDMDSLSNLELLRNFGVDCSESGVADNGALMRLAPVPLFFYRHPDVAVELSGCSGRITHGDQKAYDACRYYGALIVAALQGETKEQLLDEKFYWTHKYWFGKKELHADILRVARGSYKNSKGYAGGIRGKGDIVNALEAALWAFWADGGSFEQGVLIAVNLGDDTDTTAAIYGQLAGAYYGYQNLPNDWLEYVYAKTFMEKLSKWIAYEGECWQPRFQATASQS